MPLDGLTLGFIARELRAALAGARVERVTQPERDMLLVFLRNNGQNHKLLLSASPSFPRAHLTQGQYVNPMDAPMFCMLMRKHLTGGRIDDIRQINGDRVLLITLQAQDELGVSHPYELYLEAMGRHSNLTLVRDGRIIDAIRHVTDDMSRVRQALPGLDYLPPPAQDKIPPEMATAEKLLARLSLCAGRLDKALGGVLGGFSAVAAREVCYRLTGGEQTAIEPDALPALCERLCAFLQRMPDMRPPMLLHDENGLYCDVFPFPYLSYPMESQREAPTLSQALDRYFDGRDRRERMQQRAAGLRRLVRNHVERCEKKLALQEEELLGAARSEEYRVMGELLTAQLHLVPRGAQSVALDNYYDGQKLTVPLDVRLSPAQNAQKYFKRYQKARAAARLAKEQKEKTLAELQLLEGALCALDASENEMDLADIRQVLISGGILKKESAKKGQKSRGESLPMRFMSPEGFAISVGKNALQNERLTQSARGEDVWLHAKDMPGSHVIIHTEGREAPDDTLLLAARLAAWYCKAKGVNAPIDYTLRKFVKKPAGTPAGFVTYTRQRTLYINVAEADIKRLTQAK